MNPTQRRKRTVGVAATCLLISLFLLVWAFLIEPNRLVANERTVHLDDWPAQLDGLRIAVIADIHAGSPFIDERKLKQIVLIANELRPDLIVLLGDFVVPNTWFTHRIEPEVIASILLDLRSPLGVYAVLGNHDWWYDGPKVWRALEQAGIHVLENHAAEIQWRGGSFWLVGLADLWTRPQQIEQTIAQVPQGAPLIALTHNPDIFPRIPSNVPLLLAAHTHGGQVNLPLVGRLVVPSAFGQRYAAGLITEGSKQLFVTTGIGMSVFPVRFRVPPEIVLLTIAR